MPVVLNPEQYDCWLDFKESLIIQYFSVRQLAGPYFIRAAHGPKPFLEMPFNSSRKDIFSILKAYSPVGLKRVKFIPTSGFDIP